MRTYALTRFIGPNRQYLNISGTCRGLWTALFSLDVLSDKVTILDLQKYHKDSMVVVFDIVEVE